MSGLCAIEFCVIFFSAGVTWLLKIVLCFTFECMRPLIVGRDLGYHVYAKKNAKRKASLY